MKQEIYVFNPDNDLALAHGGGHYIAPPFAQKLEHDLAALTMWIAPKGAYVLVGESMADWVTMTSQHEKLDVSPITAKEFPALKDASFRPWGWSGTIIGRLKRMGVDAKWLPSLQTAETVRLLSHRRMSIAVHKRVEALLGKRFSPIPVELNDYDAVKAFAEGHPGCYVKMPWSGSGQGVYHVTQIDNADFEQRVRGALKRQGSLLCEIGLESVMEFALEFECKGGMAEFVGYSIFESDEHHQFGSGIVAPREVLHDMIAEQYPEIDAMKEALRQVVEELYAEKYEGYLGIDMMLYREDGDVRINPCMEVNLRTTMGVVTAKLGEKGFKGHFKIAFSRDGFNAEDFEGKMLLTPILEGTQYCAFLEV